jgi:hypothetical protein
MKVCSAALVIDTRWPPSAVAAADAALEEIRAVSR